MREAAAFSHQFAQIIGEEIRFKDKSKLLRDDEIFACGTTSGRWKGVIVLGGTKSEASSRACTRLRAPVTSNDTLADMCQCDNAEHQAFLRLLMAEHLPVASQLSSVESSSQLPQYCSAAAAKALALLFCSAGDTVMSWLAGFNTAISGPFTARVALTVPNSSIPAFEFVPSQSTFKFWATFSRPGQPSQPLRIALALHPAAEHSASLDSTWLASLIQPHGTTLDGFVSALSQPPSSSSPRVLPISFPASTAAEFLSSISASLLSSRGLLSHDSN